MEKKDDIDSDTEPDPNEPSTSADPASRPPAKDEEIIRLLAKTDEILENKAKSMNLSSLNVRSILHHLIKYPSTIDVLLGIRDNDEMPSVRNTRSRRRPDDSAPNSATQTPNKLTYRIEDKRPKNFLDLEYEEDDEFDEDYVEEEDKSPKANTEDEEEEDAEDEEDDDVEDEEYERSHVAEENPDDSLLLFEQEGEPDPDHLHITLNDTLSQRPDSTAPVATLDTVADDEDYASFVKAIQYPGEDAGPSVGEEEDEEDDEDYNVIAESLNVDDWDETRQDKTTMIPRHEVKALMMDTLLAEGEIPINAIPEEVIIGDDTRKQSQKARDQEVCERLNTSFVSQESCSLLLPRVTFRSDEIRQLQEQLQQHVQLLTQFVITCHHDSELSHVRNEAQIMMNELDDFRQNAQHSTLFDVENLDAAIESCHEINAFPPVEPMLIDWARDTDGVPGRALRPEAVVVLSRSRAIRFPALLPPTQPAFIEKPLPFLHEENIMLAMALLQFAHLPRRAEKGVLDRYSVISQNCLPARSAYKIRSHLKTMRRHMQNPTPIHMIIQAAEQGICNLSIPQKTWKACSAPISTWQKSEQPKWFRLFHKQFTVTEDQQIHMKANAQIVLTPVKRSQNGVQSIERRRSLDQNGEEKEFVEVGKGPSGQSVVLDREHLEELVMQLIHEKNTPGKRRKNPTPMKLSQPVPSTSSSSLEEKVVDKVPTAVRNLRASMGGAIPVERKLTKAEAYLPKQQQKAPISEHPECSESKKNVSLISQPPKSQKNAPKYGQYYPEPDGTSQSSFPIPPTPGRRTPDEDDFFLDLESNSLMWNGATDSCSAHDENPMTPRGSGYSSNPDPVDFSSLNPGNSSEPSEPLDSLESSEPLELPEPWHRPMTWEIDESTSSSGGQTVSNHVVSESNDEETSLTGFDLVPPDDEDALKPAFRAPFRYKDDPLAKQSRKRTRNERETMGATGLTDRALIDQQNAVVLRKIVEDVKQRLFMHTDTWHRLNTVMMDERMGDEEKFGQMKHILRHHPDVLHLMLIFAPEESLPSEIYRLPNRAATKAAMDMILVIERYVTSAKLKEPSIRSVFRYIRSFLEESPEMRGEQATARFFQLLGQDRPLWKLLEGHFWCLPYSKKPRREEMEYVDLSHVEKLVSRKERKETNARINYEIVDDINEVMKGQRENVERPNNLVVKCGELCIRNELDDTFIQLEVTERQWTRKDDITLLTRFNEAVKSDPTFTEEQMPSILPDFTFGAKSIVARLNYLLAELKAAQ